MVYVIWLILIALEVWRNWYKIEKKKVRINHKGAILIRIIVGFVFWVLIPLAVSLPVDRYWALPIMMSLTFWFLFDLGLNMARGRSYFYLGEESWLDKKLKSTVGAWGWFWWKLFLAIGGIITFEYGFKAIVG